MAISQPPEGSDFNPPYYRRIPQAAPFTCRAVTQKLETQNQKEDQISIRTTPDNAESEVLA